MRHSLIVCSVICLLALAGNDVASAYMVTSDYFSYPLEEAAADGAEGEGIELYASHGISGQYGVGTSQLTIFEGIASKLPYGTHYVYWRDGQYSFRFAYSPDLSLSGTSFSAPSVTIVTYNSYSSSGTQATYTTVQESSFHLSAGSYLVWSDLGDYPEIYKDRGVRDYVHAAVFGFALVVLLGVLDVLRRSLRL